MNNKIVHRLHQYGDIWYAITNKIKWDNLFKIRERLYWRMETELRLEFDNKICEQVREELKKRKIKR